MELVLLDAATLGDDVDLAPFSEFGHVQIYAGTAPEEIALRVQDADVILTNKGKLNASNLHLASHLKLICVAATGYDNIDIAYCASRGIAVCNVVGYSTHSVAQLTLAMALSLSCHLPEYTDFVKSGAYTAGGVANRLTPVYRELCGKTWGILGYGNIGRQVANVAEAMGCRVLVNKRTPTAERPCVPLDTLLRESDVLSVHTPLTSETRGMIGEEALSKMKSTAILINVARGAVLDEAAVAKAVKAGRIGAFGCDVYRQEPFPVDHPYNEIMQMPNVMLTPHMAWGAYDARNRCILEMAENIRFFLQGERRCRVEGNG